MSLNEFICSIVRDNDHSVIATRDVDLYFLFQENNVNPLLHLNKYFIVVSKNIDVTVIDQDINTVKYTNSIEDVIIYRNLESVNHSGFACFISPEIGMIDSIKLASEYIPDFEYSYIDSLLEYSDEKKKGLIEDLKHFKVNRIFFENFINTYSASDRLHSLGYIDCLSSSKILEGTKKCLEILIKCVDEDYKNYFLSILDDSQRLVYNEIVNKFSDFYLPGEERNNFLTIVKNSEYADVLENLNLKTTNASEVLKYSIENSIYKQKNLYFIENEHVEFSSDLSMIEIYMNYNSDNEEVFIYEDENSTFEIQGLSDIHYFGLKHQLFAPKYFYVVLLKYSTIGIFYCTNEKITFHKFGEKIEIDKFKSSDKLLVVNQVGNKLKSDNDILFKELYKNDSYIITEISKLLHQSENVKIYTDGRLTEFVLNYNDQNVENVYYASQVGIVKAEHSDYYRSKDSKNRLNVLSPRNQPLDWIAYDMLTKLSVMSYFNVTAYTEKENVDINSKSINTYGIFYGEICEEYISEYISEYKINTELNELLELFKDISKLLLHNVTSYEDYKQHLFDNISNLSVEKIDEYYDTYTNLLTFKRKDTIDFCTINLINADFNNYITGIYFPFFHPVNLKDIYYYFKNKKTVIWIASNKYYRTILLRKEITKPLFGYVTDLLEGVLFCEEENLLYLQNKFDLGNLSSIITPISASKDQINHSITSLHEYLGFSKTFNVFVVTEYRSHIEELFDCIEKSNFGEYISYNIYTNCTLDSHPYLFGIEDKAISLYTDCSLSGAFDLVIDLSGSELDTVDFSSDNHENELCIDTSYFKKKYYKYERYYYKEYYGFSKFLKSHELLYNVGGNENSVVLKYRNNVDIVKILSESKIFSTNRFRFNEYVRDNKVFIYEMRVENNLNLDNVGNNFYVGVNNSYQLKKHIAEILREFCHVVEEGKTDQLSNLILEERLFSFRSLLGNSYKLKGVVGELVFYCSFKARAKDDIDSIIIPVDLIYDRLKLFFGIEKRPDFLILKFTERILEIVLVEVKSHKNVSNAKLHEYYDEQLKPFNDILLDYLSRNNIASVSDAFINLIEFAVSNLSYDYLHQSGVINDWILTSDKIIRLGKPLIVTYENERSGQTFSIPEFNHIKFNYCDSLESFESLESDIYSRLFSNSDFEDIILDNDTRNGILEYDMLNVFSHENDQIDRHTIYDENIEEIDNASERSNLEESDLGLDEIYSIKYHQIKLWLRRKNIYVDISERSYSIGPMIVRFYYTFDTLRSSLKDLNNVMLDLGIYLELSDGQKVISGYDDGDIFLDIPMKERRFYSYSQLLKYEEFKEFGLSVVFGVDNQNQPVHLDFADSNSSHILIAGTTGSGKSIAIETILGGLLNKYKPSELLVSIVDPKGVEFVNFEDFQHIQDARLCEGIIEDADSALDLLENAIKEMNIRKALFKEERVKSLREFNEISDNPLPRHLIIIDEYAVLVSDRNYRKLLEEKLKVIAQQARFVGIHLLIATQKPTAEVINTVIKSNLPSRLALKVSSNTDSQVILDDVGAENLLGKGDAIFLFDGQMKIRLQVCKFDMYSAD